MANGLGSYAHRRRKCSTPEPITAFWWQPPPPARKRLLLASLARSWANSDWHSQYPGAIYPQGFSHLQGFWTDPLPRFCYQMGTTTLERTVSRVRNENSTIISTGSRLPWIAPHRTLIHDRSFHAAGELPPLHQNTWAKEHNPSQTRFSIFSDLARLFPRRGSTATSSTRRSAAGAWAGRRTSSPRLLRAGCIRRAEFAIIAATWRSLGQLEGGSGSERERLISLKAPVPLLARAADSFLVKRGNALSLIAGYHWFDDWGRDAMIALPGLLLSTGRYEAARLVLSSFAGAMKDGVLPNDLGARSYNTVDASLWFVQATSRYFDATGDLDFLAELWPKLLAVVERYSRPGDDFGAVRTA